MNDAPRLSRCAPRAQLFLASASLAIGLWLAAHHPLAPWTVSALLLASALIAGMRPIVCLFALPALLPVLGMAPWTGWIMVEEFDLAVLAMAAGAYFSQASQASIVAKGNAARSVTAGKLTAWLFLALLVGNIVSMCIGVAGAGQLGTGWFQSYDEPMNSLRISKSVLFCALLGPLLWMELNRDQERALRTLTAGFAAGLGVATLTIVWERLAYMSLFDFSQHYRTTGLFWEMHVGGAALDAYLAMSMPFALRALWRAKTALRQVLAATFLGLVGYACLTTFSRGLYVAIGVSLVVLVGLVVMRRTSLADRPQAVVWRAMRIAMGIALAYFVAHQLFSTSGYAGAGAMLAVWLAMLRLATGLRREPAFATSVLGYVCSGVAVGGLAAWVVSALAYGAALHFVVACALAGMLLARRDYAASASRLRLAVAGFGWLMATAIALAAREGGYTGLLYAACVAGLLIALLATVALPGCSLMPAKRSGQAITLATLALCIEAAALVGGGSYLSQRFNLAQRDVDRRLDHWQGGLALLKSPADWMFGRGLGRFPAEYVAVSPLVESPGGYRIVRESLNHFARLRGPETIEGLEGVFGISQRISATPNAIYRVALEARSQIDAGLYLSICERHLIYEVSCADATIPVGAGGWRKIHLTLDARTLHGGPPLAPRLTSFSMAAEKVGQVVDIDSLSLVAPDGRELLGNGDFAHDGARWFLSGRYYFLPWHIDNLLFELLIDRGVLALVLFAAVFVLALRNLVWGRGSQHFEAPFFAASLTGLCVVGCFGSVTDAPRVAFLAGLILLTSARIAAGTKPAAQAQPDHRDGSFGTAPW